MQTRDTLETTARGQTAPAAAAAIPTTPGGEPGFLSPLLARVASHPGYRQLIETCAATPPGGAVGPLRLIEGAAAPVVGAFASGQRAPILWLTAGVEEARGLVDALRAYLSRPGRMHLLAAPDALPFERIPWDPATRESRLAALAALALEDDRDSGPPIVVAPIRAALMITLPSARFREACGVLRPGDRIGKTALLEKLQVLGYDTVTNVSIPGQVAHRGGIVDVFSPLSGEPVRIEWFGDEVESLRTFDPVGQRSRKSAERLDLVPAVECLAADGPAAAAQLARLDLSTLHPLAHSDFRRYGELLAAGQSFPGIEFFTSLVHPGEATVLDYLGPSSWIVMEQPDQVLAVAQGLIEQAQSLRAEQVAAAELPSDWPVSPLASWGHLTARLAQLRLLWTGGGSLRDLWAPVPETSANGAFPKPNGRAVSGVRRADDHERPHPLASAFTAVPRYAGRIEEAVRSVSAELGSTRNAVVIVSRQAPRVAELLTNEGWPAAANPRLGQAPREGGIAVVHGALPAGWRLTIPSDGKVPTGGDGGVNRSATPNGGPPGSDEVTVVLTDSELFGWRMPHRRRANRPVESARSADFFSDLHPEDFVVHIEHGIGRFKGIRRMNTGGVERDYLHIEYDQGDALYVPTHQADRVTRYVGTGEGEPTVTRLGSADWERAKARAKQAVEDIAEDLLKLYAEREIARRLAFGTDTTWQMEMEAAFPYVETDDQLKAIDDVKRDMESERPMDRLVVGDVGFGKTEVAVRAAFKAVMSGRQVAVLAPTTVLAQQHFETFSRRLAAFPIRIEQVSRFRSRREQNEALKRTALGEVDVLIGTHRLLSADVTFKKLGLLVVDEEHRFGVKHKERLRQMKAGVDTLTLTATPIPRTMHMALTGLRDLTTISTPPEERLPVVTHVGPYDDTLVRQSIRRELGRGGQVFYVFNRVEGIGMIAQKVAKLVPEARIGVAHGQMNEDDLAQEMLDFVGGGTDVLICTSIIESGLDIPNANTLIVERADRFGLAQLHQLRGRVGRGAQRAYAYFLYPAGMTLGDEAEERLAALASSAELGSGFRLAMRDLEIRGAGEILGARQHGQVAAIGLDLYTRLLAEAIKKLRADSDGSPDATSPLPSAINVTEKLPTVDLPLDAFLPDDYVPDTGERTRLYRRMAGLTTREAVADLTHELTDRFGPPPTPVGHLLAVLDLRVLALTTGAESIGREAAGFVAIRWPADHTLYSNLLKARLDRRARVGNHQVTLPIEGEPQNWLKALSANLEIIAEVERLGR